MTCIAWDGKTLAADCLACSGDVKMKVSKIRRLPSGEVIAASGDITICIRLLNWYESGAKPTEFPAHDASEFSRLLVADHGALRLYEGHATAINCLSSHYASGSGREFAMGAMEMGADAVKAVEIASALCPSCGFGVESYSAI